jgi:hypothetical protein
VRQAVVRGCRGWSIAILLVGVLAGCGNFSLSGILDAPPPDAPPLDAPPLDAPPPDAPPAGPKALTLVPVTVNVPVSAVVKFTAQGGIPPYAWAEDTNGTDGFIDSAGLYTAPSTPGTYTVSVTDSDGTSQEATVFASVMVPLSISPATVTLSTDSSFTFAASGGAGSYTYDVSFGSGTINSSTGVYIAPGLVEADNRVSVTDAMSAIAEAVVTLVEPPATLQITPSSVFLVTGGQVNFSAMGGTPPYTYSVTAGTGTIAADTGLFAAPAAEETGTVRVTDASGSRTSDAAVTVYFPLTIIPTTVTVQTGSTYPFSASGGVQPYQFSKETGVGTVDSDGLYHAEAGPGAAVVKVVDLLNNASTATATVVDPVVWSIVSIDAGARSGQFASLALEPGTSLPRIAYYESQKRELRLAFYDGTAWSKQTVDTTGRVGQYSSLALDQATGFPRIAYYDAGSHNLCFASWNGTSWATATIDSAGDVGQYASLALDASGNPRIAYYDVTGKQLKYIEKNGSSWTTPVIVDTTGDVGQYASLALDTSGQPRIAYYDATNGDLKYAAWNGASWGVQTVDSGGNVGRFASLALEPGSNDPRIAYYDATNGDLKHAAWNGSSWTFETVDSAENVGQYCSLALDGSGRPRIAYYDATSKDLKYVEKNGASWDAPETVDAAGDVGKFVSLRLDPGTGKPRIAYYNATTQDLKFAKKP